MDKGGASKGPLRMEGWQRLERRLFGPGVVGIGVAVPGLLVTKQFKEGGLVVSADPVPQVVEQFDDGESLGRCPFGGYQAVEAVVQSGGLG